MSRRVSVLCLLFVFASLGAWVSEAQAQCATAWAPGVSYSVGTMASYGGHNYRCQQAHTSQVGWEPPNVAALWADQGTCSGSATPTTATATPTTRPTATPTGATATPTSRASATATATSATPTSTPTATPTTRVTATPTSNTGPLGSRLLIGYWHNFDNGSGWIRPRDVSPNWDIIHLAFGEPPGGTGSTIAFTPYNMTDADMSADVAYLHSRGKKVCLSIGGQNGHVELPTATDRTNFVNSVTAIINRYNLDGLDIDFEGGSVHIDGADSITNPTTPVITNLISAIRTIRTNTRGSNFVLTMAPETFYVQMGYYSYGGSGGAYLPLIHNLRDILTVLHVQHYNSGPIMGLDDQWHNMGNADFHEEMATMALRGFACPKGSSNFFTGVRPDQYAMGLPANVNAGNGYTSEAEVQAAFGAVRAAGYPGLRGMMAWSINWDRFNSFKFSNSHRAYLNSLP